MRAPRPLIGRLRVLAGKFPALKRAAMPLKDGWEMATNLVARHYPSVIKPKTAIISLAITSQCNLRCQGCRYGRDFMPGSRLSLDTVRTIIDDAASLGIRWIRFYGGEPLVHTDLSAMVEYATRKGIGSWISTNGWLLNGSRFKQLLDAGLGTVNIGLYGVDKTYDDYVQKPGAFETLVKNLVEVRAVSPDHRLHFSWLLAPNTCNLEQLRAGWQLAQRFDAHFQVDIVHEDGVLPYFTDGPDHCLKLDRSIPKVEVLVEELVQIRTQHPTRYSESIASIRSIPNWIRPGKIDAPCDMYKHIWIGADGSVKLCYPAFPLGNIHKARLTGILYTDKHVRAAQSAFQLNCPKCHCNRITRVQRDLHTRAQYGWGKSPAPIAALDPALRPESYPLPPGARYNLFSLDAAAHASSTNRRHESQT